MDQLASDGVPSHRAYLSVELPFTVSPSPSAAVVKAQHQAVETFVPAPFLRKCLGNAEDNKRHVSTHDMMPSDSDHDGVEDDNINDDNVETEGNPSTKATASLATGNSAMYCPAPIHVGWRAIPARETPTTSSSTNDAGMMLLDDPNKTFLESHRAEMFPSLQPQMLLHCFYRNDLLLRVTRTKRVRRLRNAETGAIEHEEEISPQDDSINGGGRIRTEVVGVVSRAVEMSRPADFSFGLFPKDVAQRHPHLCSADVFPPSHYLYEKTPYEVGYVMGKDVNATVDEHHHRIRAHHAADGSAPVVAPSMAESGGFIPTVLLSPDDPRLPPSQTPAQAAYLVSVGCVSTTGLDEKDPVEVQVIAKLFDHRPMRMTRELIEAITASGLCPRVFFNKQVVQCLSYSVSTGPFHRLRIRLGYDPYASSLSVAYQRFSVKLNRRSLIGTQLRDLSRSRVIAEVQRQLLQRHSARIAEYKERNACVGTMTELLCRTVSGGYLWTAFQLADVLDDAMYQEIVNQTATAEDMPLLRRTLRRGWLSEQAYNRVTSYFVDTLNTFIQEEVLPLLRTCSSAQPAAGQQQEEEADEEVDDAAGDEDNESNFSMEGDMSMSSGMSESDASSFE